ncbi:Ankyrin-3 [Hordeum vulgare]|nr:Ankyrin-3 [Hordeum vulgare]
MAKGRRRAVAVGGARQRGGGPAGSSSGAAAAGCKDYISAGVKLMGAHLGMHRMSTSRATSDPHPPLSLRSVRADVSNGRRRPLSFFHPGSEQSEAIKRVIESSDVVDPDRAMKMVDDVNGSDNDSSDNEEMEDYGPLHEAAGTGRMDTCKYLVEELGFDINADANNDSGMTPLACAVSRGKAIAVRYLLDKGANLNKQDNVGFSPLHYATKKGGNNRMVRLLLSKGASVDVFSSEGTPLHIAASYGKSGMMQILLQHNADPNTVSADIGTPMAAALCVASGRITESDALKCMKLLVKASADLNCANPDTPLVVATSKGLCECVEYLLEVGADANIPSNHDRMLPIEMAANSGRRTLVEILFPFTSPIQSVSNWSVEGIIAHAKLRHSNKGKQSDKDSKVQLKLNAEVTNKEDSCAPKKPCAKDRGGDKDKKAELKLLGAKAVERKDYAGALKFYSEAIKVDPEDATLYSNRSLCHLKSGEAHDALADAIACVNLQPDWAKGYYRKGAAFMSLKVR